jgi:tetratricopeptide (TPR) repeat protein/ferredoxin
LGGKGKNGAGRCDAAVDHGDPALPVAGTRSLSHVRRSRTSRWRARVLIAVHAIVAAHVTHYLVARRTVSPVEPSEAMYTLELGQVNAGFVFLAVALLLTLIFGRLFCGWGCHLVALQDLCGWIMKRMGIRPRPFRSRLLVWVPLALALYMFVWPSFERVVLQAGPVVPPLSNHFVTTSFWKTFPGPAIAVLTLVTCGFAAVYFLGAKGFCTYGCPYGGLFALADRFAPGAIVVNDSCEQCGHCTATCTSNVLVHEEVRLYGRVVDPGCMKCMDCVSVCPKNALRYAFTTPSVLRRAPREAPRAKRWALGLGEELSVLAACLGGTLAFRGLYDGPPLLMSVALGGITAFIALKSWHVLRRPSVRLQNLDLKLAGSMRRAGWAFAVLAAAWMLFAGHSAFAQWHRAWGRHHLERTEASRADVLSGAFLRRTYSERHDRAARESFRHFELADRWGLVDVREVKLGLAWGHLLHGEPDAAVEDVREALALDPGDPQRHDDLIELLASRGRRDEVEAALRAKMARVDATARDHFQLAGLLAESGRLEEAAPHYERAVELEPDAAASRYNLGGALRRLDRPAAAVEHLRIAADLAPHDAETWIELGLAHRAAGDAAAALHCLRRAVELEPESPESRLHLQGLIEEIERSAGVSGPP